MSKWYHLGLALLLNILSFPTTASQFITQDNPVPVITTSTQSIFPQTWSANHINAQAETLRPEEFKRSEQILKAATSKYPARFLQRNLSTIYVLHSLKYSGISASGTNSNKNIYIANRGSEQGFSNTWVEGTFHAEFSSILLRKFAYHLNKKFWHKLNGKNFSYGKSGVAAIKNQKYSKVFDQLSHKNGFLYQYATSTFENDFNSIAQQLFIGNKDFWLIVNEYGKLKDKTDLVIDFYGKLNPKFNKSYFKKLKKSGV